MVKRSQPTWPTAVYRLTVDGDVIKVSDDINFTNRIMLSPDSSQMV
jgi:sugar lactone lactonase YvrE